MISEFLYLFQAIIAMIFPAYQTEFPVHLLPATFTEYRYEEASRSRDPFIVIDPNTKHAEILQFFTDEKEGWSYSIVHFVPGYVIKGEGMEINIRQSGIIVRYKSSPHESSPNRQIIKRIKRPIHDVFGIDARFFDDEEPHGRIAQP